ncbi:MAG: DNA recombination protein RmuC [Tannerella sp.]|jgi:DNA recombination protein RmuC|nr:DNA recombination protein RmuC [Tannerella sp.]
MDILMILTGLATGFAGAWVIFLLLNREKNVPKGEHDALLDRFRKADMQRQIVEDRLSTQQQENDRLRQKNEVQTRDADELRQRLAEERAASRALVEKLATQKEDIETMRKTMILEFEKIAGRIMEEKSGKFTEVNKTNIEAILKPLGEHIDSFRKKVEETYDKESKQRFSLEQKVKELVEQTNKVSSEANNLAAALKGQAKKQGNWGEMILESILQQSGLVKNREYFLQQTLKDDDGRNLRPDVLVKLPDNRVIIIDSKVSLTAYDRYTAAETPDEQSVHLKEHLRSIRAHIDELQGKNYDNLAESLDFTMMFIPVEPAYLTAIQSEPDLWSHAYDRRILLISPTNLIACLKLMADLWKREMQSRNAQEIVKRGELMYEKFVSFVSTLEDVGRHIGRTQQAYENAVLQLNAGSGNLVGQAVKLKNLGLKSAKEIPVAMLPLDHEEEGESAS